MSQPPPPPHAPASWYPDPSGGGQRYWDGSTWLDLTPPPPLHVPQSQYEPAQNLAPVSKPVAAPTKATAKGKCYSCGHVQMVPVDQLLYTCDECGKRLKRHPHSQFEPAQLNTGGLPDSDEEVTPHLTGDNDEIPAWVRTILPTGLMILAAGFFAASAVTRDAIYLIPVFICGGAALFWMVRSQPNDVAPEPLSTTPQPDSVREQKLEEYMAHYISVTQGRVESMTRFSAVVVRGRKVNDVGHLLISIFTCGLWLPIWLIISLTEGEKRTVLSVDQYGNVMPS